MSNYLNIDTITATDKSAVVFKLNTPSLEQFRYLVNEINYAAIVPMEAVKQYGDLQDWKNAVGTGPFILTDYVSGSSFTAAKSTSYWDYDEVYPQNKLPYVDKVRVLIIPDDATAMAALRSGKIDIINLIPWEQAESLKKTNPELLYRTQQQNGYGIFLHVDTKPFDNIRVRQAMQKAVDYKSIAANYYGGNAMSEYAGVWVQEGYSRPFSEWPAEVQAGYTFDVTAAKKLLSDAGYPSGFQFTMLLSSSSDSDLFQIVKSYFLDVGINMDIQVLDAPSFEAITRSDKHVAQGYALVWWNAPPQQLVNQRKSTHYPYRHHINSPEYDAMWAQVNAAISDQDQVDTILKMFDLATREQWTVNLPPSYNYIFWQPWLKRYNGINTQMHPAMGELFARLWIDENLK
jgi:peptide/nickel transport system substrate-binding protein